MKKHTKYVDPEALAYNAETRPVPTPTTHSTLAEDIHVLASTLHLIL